MLGLLKKRDKDKEVATNPDILFNFDVETSEIKVYGLKLHDNVKLIPLNNISTTTFEKPPEDILYYPNGGTSQTWKDNKVYYESTSGLKEYNLIDRINSVLAFGGILHMKSGAKYVIENNSIVGIGIHQEILSPYKKIPKSKIEVKFGKASKITEEYEEVDGTLFNTEYIFKNRSIKIVFSEWDKQIMFINIGLFPYS